MRITWYGHSCFKIETAQGSAVIDPYETSYVPGLTLPELEADAVLCTHEHHDHGFRAGVKLSGREPTFEVKRIHTFHDEVLGRKRGRNELILIKAEGYTLLHMGDIGCGLSPARLREIGHVDVLLIPVGGYYTIDGAKAHALAERIGAEIAVPMHYRSGSIGFPELDTAEKFLALSDKVTELAGNSFELPCGLSGTVVLRIADNDK